jgi:Uma2 family endonuclease
MNQHARPPMTPATFFRWAEGREGRYELKDGAIAMMVGSTIMHAWITADLQEAVRARLDRRRWRVATTDIAIEIGADIRYPDVVVLPSSVDGRRRSSSLPVLVAEVLSPSSAALDLHVKAAEYMSLNSLETYIVAAQDEPRLWIWNRSAESGRAWPKAPEPYFGREVIVPVPALGLALPMAEIFEALPEPESAAATAPTLDPAGD